MPLAAGTRLGPYEILGPLGAGGMGEVYRARDTRLDRAVAVKVLPSGVTPTPELRARFEREARAASALNHPHICVIYDVGQQDGAEYLVMELLDGETLAARLERGPLPPADVLRYGIEIADALERAHRGGIVHRDLKPGNIMLTKSGAKLMDFGLARSTGLAPSVSGLTQSPTVTRPLTAEGTIVGTFQYMAPEQLEGKEADARTDLFAFGAVLFEMATGRKAFEGKSQASLISAIMTSQPPPIATFSPLSPPALDQVVRECLAKDADERLQSAHDLKLQLQWIRDAGSQAGVPVSVAARRTGRERISVVAAAVAALIAIAALALPRFGARKPAPEPIRFTVAPPEGVNFVGDAGNLAVSPDGRMIAFVASDTSGVPRLWIRALGTLDAHLVPETDGAQLPFWSPDSRVVAYFASGKLWKVPIAGGAPEAVCGAPNGRGGTWNRDGVILFAPLTAGPLARVNAEGGEPVTVLEPDSAKQESGLRFPSFLPDGRHFLFAGLPGREATAAVHVGTLDSKERTPLLTAAGMPSYAEPGYLIVARRGKLLAQPFDPRTRKLKGKPIVIGDSPVASSYGGSPLVSVSATGVLAYTDARLPNTELRWFDRNGNALGRLPVPAGRYEGLALSPDGKRLAAKWRASATETDLWVIDLERMVPMRLTFTNTADVQAPNWSPDGQWVAFNSNRDGAQDIYVKPADGSLEEQRLLPPGPMFRTLGQWTFDGRYLIYEQPDPVTGWDTWAVPVEADPSQPGRVKAGTPFACLHSRSNERAGAVSPDGRWIGYISDDGGRPELCVQSFPTAGRKVQVSTSGAALFAWSITGKELLMLGVDNTSYAVPVQTGATFQAGMPKVLSRQRPDIVTGTGRDDLSQFLLSLPAGPAATPTITVELNWMQALKH